MVALLAIAGCTEPKGGLPGAGAYTSADVNPGALTDYSNYQPAAYEPIKPPVAAASPAASGASAANAADVPAELNDFVAGLWTAVASGDTRKLVSSLSPAQAAAFTDARLAAISPTLEKLALLRRSLAAKFGESATAALDAAQSAATITPLNATSATVSPHPYLLLLGPQAGTSITVDKADAGWQVTLGTVPDDAGFEAVAAYHARVQSGLDRVTDGVESGTLDQGAAMMALAQAIAGVAVAAPEVSATGASSNSNSNTNGGG